MKEQDLIKKFQEFLALRQECEKLEKRDRSKGQEGVHTSGGFSGLEEKGQSQAGRLIERGKEPQPNEYLGPMYHGRGVDMHRKILNKLKSMPKPNLPKSELDKKDKPAGATLDYGKLRQEYKEQNRTRSVQGQRMIKPVSLSPKSSQLFNPGTSGKVDYKTKKTEVIPADDSEPMVINNRTQFENPKEINGPVIMNSYNTRSK